MRWRLWAGVFFERSFEGGGGGGGGGIRLCTKNDPTHDGPFGLGRGGGREEPPPPPPLVFDYPKDAPGGWHGAGLCCCLQPAAPLTPPPLSAALPLNPLPLQVAAPIGLSPPRALPPPACPILTPPQPLPFPRETVPTEPPGPSLFHCSAPGPHGGGPLAGGVQADTPIPAVGAPQSSPEGGGGGGLEPKSPKVWVRKTAQINISFCKISFCNISFFPAMNSGSEGGGC